MDSFAQFWWLHLPAQLRRGSKLLSEVWFDGAYLTAWPKAALIAPMAVFVFGLLEGATHWSLATLEGGRVAARFHAVDFSQMLPLLFVAAICGALSSQLGLLLVAGYALGDLLIAPAAFGPGPDITWRLTHLYAPQLISYYAFALLAVTPALTAKVMAATLPAWLRKSGISFLIAGGVTACLVEGSSVYAWTAAAPMIVRVHWLWPGGTPPTAVFDYMLALNPWLPLTAGLAMATRLGLSAAARKSVPQDALTGARQQMSALDVGQAQGIAGMALQAVVFALATTITICGLFDSVMRAAWVFIIVLGLFLVRAIVLPKVDVWRWWGQTASGVPLLLRWAASIFVAFVITRGVVAYPKLSPRAVMQPGAFGAEISCFLLSLALALILLPPAAAGAPAQLPPMALRSGKLAVLLCLFVLATRRAYAGICLDPFCCFGASAILAALVIAALLVLLLPVLLDALLFSRVAILLGMAVEDALAALTGSAFAQSFIGRLLLGGLGLYGAQAEEGAEEEAAEWAAKNPAGSRGAPLDNAPYQPVRNAPGTINGQDYSGHALDRMQDRGIPPSAVKQAIQAGIPSPGKPGTDTTIYYDPVNRIKVIVGNTTHRVVTVY